jgi:hypothetical protein
MTDWISVQDALHAAVVTASGLAGARVRWDRASRDQPATPGDVIILSLGGEQTDGPSYTSRDNPVPSTGSEILLETEEQIDAEMVVDYYSMTQDGARAALQRCYRNLRRESVQDALDESDIAFITMGTPQHIPAILETEFRDRARGVVKFRCADGSSESATFIESTTTIVGSYT